jgi:hypothetical protein
LDPYIVGHYWLKVANDVFNSVEMSGLVILSRCPWSAVRRHAVGSPCTVVVPAEWSIGSTLNYSDIVAVCSHVLQALVAVPARTSYRLMMVLKSGALKTCARALQTDEPCRTGRPTRSFFMLEARNPQGTAGHVAALKPTSGER